MHTCNVFQILSVLKAVLAASINEIKAHLSDLRDTLSYVSEPI